jgi:polyisoprenoid-binding protein YceI
MLKRQFFISLIVIAICAFSLSISQAAVVHAKKGESVINYKLVHPLHTVDATCKDCDCDVYYDDTSFKIMGVNVSAGVLSFDSGNSNRDSHMGEVVDAIDYPTVSFKSDTVKALNSDTLWVEGELTFHDVTKPISFKTAESFQTGETFFTGNFDISLTAFKIQRPTLLLMPVEDKLAISFKMVIPMLLKK